MTEIVHGLGDDKQTCHCGEPWPCDGWWTQPPGMVLDRGGQQIVLDTYRDVPPQTRARLEAEMDRRSKCSKLI